MNERIKELEKLASEVVHSHGAFGEYEAYNKLNVEKFAELIVQECATICKDTAEKQFSPLYNRESDGATVCYKKIKEHFGVE